MVQLARLRTEEAQALREGAGVVARSNPDLSVSLGPRWYPQGTATDYYAALSIPFDVSGAPSLRVTDAEQKARVAEANAAVTARRSVAEALDVWARARAAEGRAALELSRAALDDELLRASQVRRAAGVVGDGEMALVIASRAQTLARKRIAEGEGEALVVELRARLGLSPAEPVALSGELTPPDLSPVAALTQRLPDQATAVRARAAVREAVADDALQGRLAFPEPRLSAAVAQEQERFAHFGIDIPLPLFQRNQTNRAVSTARMRTARTEEGLTAASMRADLETAYATYAAARDAFRQLDAVRASVDDAERLAVRGYELGQSTLLEVLAVRRETTQARAARLDAQLAYARAAIAVSVVAGTLP